jgi:hypothetical protein
MPISTPRRLSCGSSVAATVCLFLLRCQNLFMLPDPCFDPILSHLRYGCDASSPVTIVFIQQLILLYLPLLDEVYCYCYRYSKYSIVLEFVVFPFCHLRILRAFFLFKIPAGDLPFQKSWLACRMPNVGNSLAAD